MYTCPVRLFYPISGIWLLARIIITQSIIITELLLLNICRTNLLHFNSKRERLLYNDTGTIITILGQLCYSCENPNGSNFPRRKHRWTPSSKERRQPKCYILDVTWFHTSWSDHTWRVDVWSLLHDLILTTTRCRSDLLQNRNMRDIWIP